MSLIQFNHSVIFDTLLTNLYAKNNTLLTIDIPVQKKKFQAKYYQY